MDSGGRPEPAATSTNVARPRARIETGSIRGRRGGDRVPRVKEICLSGSSLALPSCNEHERDGSATRRRWRWPRDVGSQPPTSSPVALSLPLLTLHRRRLRRRARERRRTCRKYDCRGRTEEADRLAVAPESTRSVRSVCRRYSDGYAHLEPELQVDRDRRSARRCQVPLRDDLPQQPRAGRRVPYGYEEDGRERRDGAGWREHLEGDTSRGSRQKVSATVRPLPARSTSGRSAGGSAPERPPRAPALAAVMCARPAVRRQREADCEECAAER